MSANPRSPESGDVPKDFADRLAACAGIPNALRLERHTRGFGDLLDGVLRDAARLTAELSTARERADRAEQELAAYKRAVCCDDRTSTPTPTPDHA